jgi:hypothetical protein
MTEDRWVAFGDYNDDYYFNEGVKFERERITKLLLQRLEYFDCDICGECVTPTRLAEMIQE